MMKLVQYGALLTLGNLGIVFHLQVPQHDGPIKIGNRQGRVVAPHIQGSQEGKVELAALRSRRLSGDMCMHACMHTYLHTLHCIALHYIALRYITYLHKYIIYILYILYYIYTHALSLAGLGVHVLSLSEPMNAIILAQVGLNQISIHCFSFSVW